MECYGFVYIWFDKNRNMYYIGAHRGCPDDPYAASSKWLNGEIQYRPQDFKRRVIKICSSESELFKTEANLIRKIKDEEFGIKYYNKKSGRKKGCIPHNKGAGKAKYNGPPRKRGRPPGFTSPTKGIPLTEEHKAKVSATRKKLGLGKQSAKHLPKLCGDKNPMRNPNVAKKFSKQITGRKMATREDGTRHWVYPKKNKRRLKTPLD